MWEPSQIYPDPAVQVLDASFNQYRLPLASVEQLATGCRWSEGPVYVGDGRYVLWSDIPNDRILKWEEETGAVSVFRKTRRTPTAIRATARDAWSPVSIAAGASPAPNMTARSPC